MSMLALVNRSRSNLLVALLITSSLALALGSHRNLQVSSASPPLRLERLDFERPSLLAYTGYGNTIGAVSWISTIQAYAEVVFMDGSPSELPAYFYLASQTDTLWDKPLLMAGWALPQVKGLSNADAEPFLRGGATRFPGQWKFRTTWAAYILESVKDSAKARDSAAAVLLPLTRLNDSVPTYARNLAFTLLHKNGRPEEAMGLLLETYQQVPDPLVRHQFRVKIMDLLHRNQVSLGTDSVDFQEGLAQMLEATEDASRKSAHRLLVDLVDTTRRAQALPFAHNLAQQYAAYRRQMAAK